MYCARLAFYLCFSAVVGTLGLTAFAQGQDADQPLTLGGRSPAAKQPAAPQPVLPHAAPVRLVHQGQRIVVVDKTPGMSDREAWKQHFNTITDRSPDVLLKVAADVRETCRELKYEQKYNELIAMINGALSAGYPQPWMYEALAIAMQLNGSPKKDVERALMSAVDFSTSEEDMMFVAAYMANNGFDNRALKLFESISGVDPARPEPYIQGMNIAERLDDLEAKQWATVGVLRQAWPREHQDIENKARLMAKDTLRRLFEKGRKEGRMDEYTAYQNELNKALVRDCLVKVTWTGDADVDIMVEEPAGTVCSLQQPKTTSGGVLVGDAYSTGESSVDGTTEWYICPEGFSGHYRMLLRRIWGEVTAATVTVDLWTSYGGKNMEHKRLQAKLAEAGAICEWDLQNGRRQESLSDQQVAVAARTNMEITRAVVAQQLNLYENSQATRDYEKAVRKGVEVGRITGKRGGGRRGRPGYRPVITRLPQGTRLMATAVISADRRYVRVTPMPLFSAIGQVNTFNFKTGGGGTMSMMSGGMSGTMSGSMSGTMGRTMGGTMGRTMGIN